MNNFMIGMHGKYEGEKYIRDFKKGFFGVEACLFDLEEDIDKLYKKSQEDDFKIGIHFPLKTNDYICRDPLFLSLKEEEREEAFQIFEAEIKKYKKVEPEYILVHFPKPGIVNENLDFSSWRFANDKEWIFEKDYKEEELKNNCEEMFRRLTELSSRYDIKIILENDVTNKLFYEGDFLVNLLKKYPTLGMCMDVGRLHLMERVDKEFDSKAFMKKMAPYTKVIHLWNVKLDNNVSGGHYPCMPHLKVSDGWADVEAYMNIISKLNKDVLVKFEHRSDLISEEELETCYNWINSFFK